MSDLRFKVGDKVVVIARHGDPNAGGHGFEIGTTAVIDEVFDRAEDPHYRVQSDKAFWYLEDDELEAATA